MAGWEATRNRNKVFQDEATLRLVHDTVYNVRYGHPLQGVKVDVSSHVRNGLKHHSPHRRMLYAELHKGTDFVHVDAFFDRRDQDRIQPCAFQAVKSLEFQVEQVLSSQRQVRFLPETVKLEVDDGIELGQAVQEPVVPGNTNAVRVDHHLPDAPVLRRLHHIQQLGMNGRFTSAELHHLRVPFRLHKPVEHPLDLSQSKAIAYSGVGETNRAIQVAGGVDLDKAQANVLFMLRAQSAVEGTAVQDFGAELQGHGPRLVELDGVHIHLSVGTNDALEPIVVRAPFAHVDLVVPDDHLSIDDPFAFGANAAGQLMEDVVGVSPQMSLLSWFSRLMATGSGHYIQKHSIANTSTESRE